MGVASFILVSFMGCPISMVTSSDSSNDMPRKGYSHVLMGGQLTSVGGVTFFTHFLQCLNYTS